MKILLAGRNYLLESVLIKLVNLHKNDEFAIIDPLNKILLNEKIKTIIKKKNIKVYFNKKNFLLEKIILSYKPDIFISCGYNKILKKNILKKIIFPINIHFADLPKYKGFFSIPHAIRNNEKKIGVSIHIMNEKVDSGKIISKKFIKNSVNQSAYDIYLKAVKIAVLEISRIVKFIKKNKKIYGIKQIGRGSFYNKYSLQKYKLSFSDHFLKILNYIRSFHFPPYKGLKCYSKNLVFHFIHPLKFKKKKVKEYGKLIKINNNFCIKCYEGVLIPKYVLFKNKKLRFNLFIKKYKLFDKVFYL